MKKGKKKFLLTKMTGKKKPKGFSWGSMCGICNLADKVCLEYQQKNKAGNFCSLDKVKKSKMLIQWFSMKHGYHFLLLYNF